MDYWHNKNIIQKQLHQMKLVKLQQGKTVVCDWIVTICSTSCMPVHYAKLSVHVNANIFIGGKCLLEGAWKDYYIKS